MENKSKRTKEAQEFREKEKKSYRTSLPDYIYYKDKATSLLKNLKFESALENFEKALSYNLKCLDYYPFYKLAEIQLKLQKPEEALKNINEALRLNKDFQKLLLIKADVLLQLGELEQCAEEFGKAFEITNSFYETPVQYKIQYANVLVGLNEKEKALQVYNDIIKNDLNRGSHNKITDYPNSDKNSSDLNSTDFKGLENSDYPNNDTPSNYSKNNHNYNSSNNSSNNYISSKTEFFIYFNKGEILRKLGRYAEAMETYNKATQFKTNEKELQLKKAKVMAKLKQYSYLDIFLKRFIKLNSLDVRGFMKKGEIRICAQTGSNKNSGEKVNVINTSEFSQIKRIEKELNTLKDEISRKDELIKTFQDSIELRKIQFDTVIRNFNERLLSGNSPSEPKCPYTVKRMDLWELDLKIPTDFVIETQSKSDKFNCILCNNIAAGPKSCIKCEALFCGKCLNAALRLNTKCPNCRVTPFNKGKISRSFMEKLNKLKIRCPLDCDFALSYGELENHLQQSCRKTPIIYTCDLCGKKIRIDSSSGEDLTEIKEHNKFCSQLIMECQYCENSFQVALLPKHRIACEERKDVFCDKCGLLVIEECKFAHGKVYCELVRDLIGLR